MQIPRSGGSPGEGNGNPLQYSCLENSIPWTEEPGGLQSIGSQRVTYDLGTEHFVSLIHIFLLLLTVKNYLSVTFHSSFILNIPILFYGLQEACFVNIDREILHRKNRRM